MLYERQMGEPVDLRAALPDVTKMSRYDYDSALRRRLAPTDAIGNQQNLYSARKAEEAQSAMYQQRLQAMLGARGSGGASADGMVQAPNGQWYHPLGNGMRPTFGFGATYKDGGSHRGNDWAVPGGTPVYSTGNGRLLSAGWGDTGFGNEIRAQYGDMTGIYGHLSSFADGLTPGMAITPGMLLGYVGNTGNSTGDHLHYEMRDRNGRSVNYNSYYGW